MQRVRVGVLECRGGASIGFVVGSVTNLGCVLRVDGVPEDRYVATILKVGVDLGITQETRSPGASSPRRPPRDRRSLGRLRRRPGLLRSASGPAATCWSAARPIDRAAAAELAGQVGLNVAAGLESLELRPVVNCSSSGGE